MNKVKVIIIHGAYGTSKENWFPWLEMKLKNDGVKVYIPKFPTPEGQTLDNWMKVFNKYLNILDENTILVGHSLGPAFILNVLERVNKVVKAAFLVAPFVGSLGNPKFDTFTDKKFDWERIKSRCKKFYIYASDNDPYVPLEKSKYLAKKLDAVFRIVSGAGHFNEAAGYIKFELLLEDIEEML